MTEEHFEKEYPFQKSPVISGSIIKSKILYEYETKKVYQIEIDYASSFDCNFAPGDTISFLPKNNINEVDGIIRKIGLNNFADVPYTFENELNGNKNLKHIPKHTTIRDIFFSYLDIRSIPKKIFLKALRPYVTDPEEISKLESLCDIKNKEDYNEFVRGPGKTLFKLLGYFRSCKPPFELILKYLPRLLPRPYSIASSPLRGETFDIIFSVETFDDALKGVCSSYLESLLVDESSNSDNLSFYFRQENNFRYPINDTVPLILIATGTGVAPFKGFLEHKELTLEKNLTSEIYLFYGCRHHDIDYLFKDYFSDLLNSGILTKIFESFSRDREKQSYVTENLIKFGAEIINLIHEKNAVVFLCGSIDMIKDSRKSFLKILTTRGNYSEKGADDYIKSLERNHRFNIDTWD